MPDVITPQEYLAFSEFLTEESGIVLGDNKQYLVASRLRGLMGDMGLKSLGELLQKLRDRNDIRLRQRIIDAMTTHETLWFRDQYAFESLKRIILPELERQKVPTVRIWSAGCASGQEPYSISMTCQEYRAEYPKHPLGNVQITATDISPTILRIAREGIYEEVAMARGLMSDRRDRFFDSIGEKVAIKPEIKQQVVFREFNLKNPFVGLGRFHVVFCRNVMIYFSDELKTIILSRIASVMEPNGYLFLGGSETISRYSDKFESIHAYGGMAFRLKSP